MVVLDVYLYAHHPDRPSAPGEGWERFWDQGQYAKSARALAEGDLRADEHWYPIGYSLFATPFVRLLPRDPFLVVNVLSLAIFAAAFFTYFRPVIGSLAAGCAFFGALVFPSRISTPQAIGFPMWSQFVVPWSTTPIAAIYLCLLCLMRGLDGAEGVGRDFWIGALAALTLAIKPMDAFPLLVLVPTYLWRRRNHARRAAHVAAACTGVLGVGVPVVALTVAIHGGLSSPYLQESSRIGMSLSDLHERAYAILLNAGVTFGEPETALLELQPWLYVLIPLAFVWAACDSRNGLLPVMLVLASSSTYLSYNDFWPFNLLRFSLIHYIVWTLPVVAAGGLAGALILIRGRQWKTALAVAAIALAAACYRLERTVLTPDTVAIKSSDTGLTNYVVTFDRPRDLDAIDLAGASSTNWITLTVVRIKIAADGEPLDLFSGYRLIQLPGGIRIIFNRHVAARRLEFDLDKNVTAHPFSGNLVRPVRFRARFFPFWYRKTLAVIGAPDSVLHRGSNSER